VASPGLREFRWDGRDMYGDAVANGVYVYRVTSPSSETAGRIVRVR
jgi:hypothetical protein